MPTAKPRLNLTLPQHRYDLLKRLADIQGVSMSSVVTDVMEEVYPVLERVCVVLEAALLAKKTSKEGLRVASARQRANWRRFSIGRWISSTCSLMMQPLRLASILNHRQRPQRP